MSASLLSLLMFGLGAGFAASGGEEPSLDPALVAAEHQRLSGEIQQMARRQAWAGAEQHFTELVSLGIAPDFDDLIFGAHAARGIGDAQSASDRLRQAARIQSTAEIKAWLSDLATGYGRVELSSASRRPVALVPDALPFAPDQRAAVEFAVRTFAEQGRFDGLLPVGTYHLGDSEVVVEADITLRIEVSARAARDSEPPASAPQQAAAPEGEPLQGDPGEPPQP